MTFHEHYGSWNVREWRWRWKPQLWVGTCSHGTRWQIRIGWGRAYHVWLWRKKAVHV